VDLPGIDKPNEWDKEGIHDEHDCFFLNHTIRVLVEVAELDVLDG